MASIVSLKTSVLLLIQEMAEKINDENLEETAVPLEFFEVVEKLSRVLKQLKKANSKFKKDLKEIKGLKEKTKRLPNSYNLFIKEHLARLKLEDESNGIVKSSQARMKDAIDLWNASKG